ncbi:hypothetical protein [Aureimonas endophytica]|nr:hypothetical protein [Aureimonas endophytica]
MQSVDPLVIISLFGLVVAMVGLIAAEIAARRFDRRYGRKGD